MRYFFRSTIPPLSSVLVIESGSRHLLDKFVPHFLQRFSGDVCQLDLLTCWDGAPEGFPAQGRIYPVQRYRGFGQRLRLLRELRRNGYTVAVAICSGEPLLLKWKWSVAFALPVKLLVLNENGDYFWFDWSHRHIIRQLVSVRLGLRGMGWAGTAGRLLLFPFTLGYLLLYTAAVHLQRRVRLWTSRRLWSESMEARRSSFTTPSSDPNPNLGRS